MLTKRAYARHLGVTFGLVLTSGILAPSICRAHELKPECRTVGDMHIMFAAGTSERYKDDVVRHVIAAGGGAGPDYQIQGRWTVTATNPSTGATGNPITLTWSYVPDGTFIPNGGLGSGPNDFNARMNTLFGGNTALWQSKVAAVFQRWNDLLGTNYIGPVSDDGAALHTSPGLLGSRGDLRIAGRNLDGVNGVLAYNYFPNTGDMVMDTAESWQSGTNDYRFLRNTMMHEHGHGMGLAHVDPTNGTKLMEAFLNTNFDGPQNDDIQGGQFLYGDYKENDDTAGTAAVIGTVTNGQAVTNLSLNRSTDPDFFRVTIPEGFNLNVTATPVGATYLQGPQGGATSSRNSLSILNLRVSAYQTDGVTLIGSNDTGGLGQPEVLANIVRPASGEVIIKIDTATSLADIQRYTMTFNLVAASQVVQPNAFGVAPGVILAGGLPEIQTSNNAYLDCRPGVTLTSTQPPLVITASGVTSILGPTSLKLQVEAHASVATISRSLDMYNINTSNWEEVQPLTAMSTTDVLTEITINSNPGRFVDGSGLIQVRCSHKATGPVLVYPWVVNTDMINWVVTP
jgi:hypothetical protein